MEMNSLDLENTRVSRQKGGFLQEEVTRRSQSTNKLIAGAVTCVAWPCCCSCWSCCAVRKLTGLFPAISFVPAGIVVRMIFLPNPLMLREEQWERLVSGTSRPGLSDSDCFSMVGVKVTYPIY